MPQLGRHPHMAALARATFPRLGSILSGRQAQSALALTEVALEMLQGKGSGAGWDIGAETAVALRHVRPGAVVLDVGANRGEWSAQMLDGIGDLQLYLFEPQASCAPVLQSLVERGAVLIPAAVGEAPGAATLYSPGGTSGLASLHARRDTFVCEDFLPAAVDMVTLDGFMAERGISVVDFLKLDVEGHELFALRGARKALEAHGIRALTFEFGSGNVNSRTFFRDFWDLLTGCGYSLARILPGGRTAKIARYDEDMEHFRGVSNYVAVAGRA